jgi:spermidine/putrescine-binding protein
MKISRLVPVMLLLSVIAPLLAACGAGGGEGQAVSEIQLFNWSEYIDPEIYTMFEEETGIRVVESNFANNEEMLAKVQGGGSGYDIVVPSDYTVTIMVEEGLLAELNHDNIPNLENLRDDMRDLPFDPGNRYCVPYQWGMTGLGYDSATIDAPQSWAVLFEPDPDAAYYGRATMLDDPREGFAAALIYLGYDINTTDEAQLREAQQLLLNAKQAIFSYDSDQFEDLLASGESVLAHGWNGDMLVGQEENEDIAFTVPGEGSVIWIDNLCILAGLPAERQAAAEQFINFLLRPDIGALITEYNYYASPNAAAEAELDPAILEDPTVYPPDEVLDKLQFIRPVGEFESVYQRLWDEVKAAQ